MDINRPYRVVLRKKLAPPAEEARNTAVTIGFVLGYLL